MSSAAQRFAVGHRVRRQISGGAQPRHARGLGNGDSPVEATTFIPVRITLHADSAPVLAVRAHGSRLGPAENG